MSSEKRVGIIATRLGGMDGVSLEVAKWSRVLRKEGNSVYWCVGEKGGKAYASYNITVIPALSVESPENKQIMKNLFRDDFDNNLFRKNIKEVAEEIEPKITGWVKKFKLKKIIVNNVNALPIHLPLAEAVDNVLGKNPDILALLHHHDFYWERPRYFTNSEKLRFYIRKYFPPHRKNVIHVVINSSAERELKRRHNLSSIVIPNIFDRFTAQKDDFNLSLKKDFGLEKDDVMFLLPCRIVPRKNMETAIELVATLKNPRIKLVISGCADSYDLMSTDYLKKIKKFGDKINRQLVFVCDLVGPRREKAGQKKIYSLADTYAYADFMIYPSSYEGWGNAFGEAMAFGVPTLVNRYKIFKQDIEPYGFRVIKINKGKLNDETIKEVNEILNNRSLRRRMIEHNQKIIKEHFGPETLLKKLKPFLDS